MKKLMGIILLAVSFGAFGQQAVSVQGGWNLLGNTSAASLDVAATFAQQPATSVWKWSATKINWQFYAPTLDADGTLASYIGSNGYEALKTIAPGEGFWVNARSAFTLQLPPGTIDVETVRRQLVPNWNLIAQGGNMSPWQFNKALSASGSQSSALSATDVIPTPAPDDAFKTLWAWDNPTSRWYFYAPTLDANGTLADYNMAKGYLDFGSMPLAPGMGVWVSSLVNNGLYYTEKKIVSYIWGYPYFVEDSGELTKVKNMTGINVIVNCDLYRTPIENGIIPVRCFAGINGVFVVTRFYIDPLTQELHLYTGPYVFDEAKWSSTDWGSWEEIPPLYAAHDVPPLGYYIELTSGVMYIPGHESWVLKLSSYDFSTTRVVTTAASGEVFRFINVYSNIKK